MILKTPEEIRSMIQKESQSGSRSQETRAIIGSISAQIESNFRLEKSINDFEKNTVKTEVVMIFLVIAQLIIAVVTIFAVK